MTWLTSWMSSAPVGLRPERPGVAAVVQLAESGHGTDGGQARRQGVGLEVEIVGDGSGKDAFRGGIIVAEGNTVACQTWIEGTFVREFIQSPAGPLPPTGTRVVMDLINIFRFDDDGRLIEEWVRTDYRSLLRQLGAEGR
jgi:hypothetical protein